MYNVGDKIKIRSFRSLKNEFGSYVNDDILMDGIVFVRRMKCFCGSTGTILQTRNTAYRVTTYSVAGMGYWSFSEQMFDLNYRGGGEINAT